MAVTKGMESISCALKRQFEFKKYLDEEDNKKPSLDTRLFSSASRVLEAKVDFEPSRVQSYTVLSNLKGKYKVLLPPKKAPADMVSASCSKIITTLQTGKRCESEGSPKKGSVKPSPVDSSTPPAPPVSLFPEDGIKLGWKGNEPVGAGMINLGNTCYLNSTLQALFHVPSFCNWLTSESQHNGIGRCDQAFISGDMCLICAMVSTLRITQTHTGNVMKPVLIYGRLKSICKHLSHGHQEDAHEFLRFLVEGMERCYLLRFKGKKLDNLTKETTPLHRIFGGYLRNEVVCHSCGTTSTTFQLFQDLFLDIRHTNSLMESMQAFFSRERLEGDDRNDSYKCEKCKRKGNCSKRVYVQTPPKVLCFQLKRFTAMGKKIMKHISYPLKLDLSPYVYIKTFNKNGDIVSPQPKVRRPIPYKLVSLVSHYGSAMTCGHYTAVGRSAKGSYFTFDDSLVRPASLNSALGASAYILIYEMEAGWNVGMGDNNGERVNDSLRPSKSLPELSRLCSSQPSLSKSVVYPEPKANSLLEVLHPQHSKAIQETTGSPAPKVLKLGVAKSSSSKMETDSLTPAVPKPEALESSCTSLSIPDKITVNGCLKKDFTILAAKLSPSTLSCKNLIESHISNQSPNQSQDTSNVIKRRVPLQFLSEDKVKKEPSGVLKGSDSESQKELKLKNSKSSLNSFCENVKQISTQKDSKNITPKELNKDQKKRITTKRKHSNEQSPFSPKKQLTLPDLINRKNNANNSGARIKIKTLKDWLEIRSTSKGENTIKKGLHQPRMLSQVKDVKSTVSGWKVTSQNATSGSPVSDSKCNNVALKRKKEVVAILDENKKKKFDQAANAQLWRTFFKNKISNSKLNPKVGNPGSTKNKRREKTDVNSASEQTDSIGSQGVFKEV